MKTIKWWQEAVIYQIYPRSFMDSNGNGVGDFQGITSKLDYLKELGVDAIWLSPHYPSPFYDCGYDISDYLSVAPEYGSMEDFKRLLDGIHQRGMRLILDLVLNHTSEQHAWFIESRSSRDNPKRDWYVWRDGDSSGPPNNWMSIFGGPAWEYDPLTEQYYYHYFFKQQPDLNWRNPDVRHAMWDMVRFWLDLGIDGFRLDAIGAIYENPALEDHECPLTQEQIYQISRNARSAEEQAEADEYAQGLYEKQLKQPGIHDLMKELRSICNEYEDIVLIGETEDISFYGSGGDELDLVFNFPLLKTDLITPGWVRDNQQERLPALPPAAWPSNTLGNHDIPRSIERYGDGQHNQEQARIHIAMLLTLRGTPFIYYGEEIGMENIIIDDISAFKDMLGIWYYHIEVEKLKTPPLEALEMAARGSRDQCRTPMQWANLPHAGFSSGYSHPWLPVNPNYKTGVNVEDQKDNPESLLNLYRRLIHLRKRTPALLNGSYLPIHEKSEHYLAFIREAENQNCLIVLNFSDQDIETGFNFPEKTASLIFSSQKQENAKIDLTSLKIEPFEIFIAELNETPS